MFNRRESDDLAVVREIVQSAVSTSRVPGQTQSGGNAAGAVSLASNAVPAGTFNGSQAEDGTPIFVCLTEIDSTDSGAVTEP